MRKAFSGDTLKCCLMSEPISENPRENMSPDFRRSQAWEYSTPSQSAITLTTAHSDMI